MRENSVLEILRTIRRDNTETRMNLLSITEQGRRIEQRMREIERRMNDLERRMGEVTDDIELILKARLIGHFSNLQALMEARLDTLAAGLR